MKPRTLGYLTAFVAFAADQLSKHWILDIMLLPFVRQQEIAPFFNLTMVWNRGVSFGMFGNDALSPWVFITIAGLATLLLLRWLHATPTRCTALAIGLIIGGALGNVRDRLRFGAVADFFDFFIGQYHWPAFNIADSCIFIGVCLLCYESFRPPRAPVSH